MDKTNAQRQARWREREKAKQELIDDYLREHIAALSAALAKSARNSVKFDPLPLAEYKKLQAASELPGAIITRTRMPEERATPGSQKHREYLLTYRDGMAAKAAAEMPFFQRDLRYGHLAIYVPA